MPNFIICEALNVEIPEIFRLIKDSFNCHVAPGYTEEGIDHFFLYCREQKFLERRINHKLFVAKSLTNREILGVIEIRDLQHISLFFTRNDVVGTGIGHDLHNYALSFCLNNHPDLKEITVNSSPYAVDIYSALGFKAVEGEKLLNGILFTPMVLDITKKHP
jgi:hypothetical protein